MKIGLIGLGKLGANLAMNFKDHHMKLLDMTFLKLLVNQLQKRESK